MLTLASTNTNGRSATYTYDSLNRLSTVTDNRMVAQGGVPGNASGLTTYGYDPVGNLAGYAYPNGVQTSYSYDALNRLQVMGAAKAATPLSSYTYTLGAAGNRKTVAELTGRMVQYGYDSLYRLNSETVTADPANHNGLTTYVYDPVGNRQVLKINGVTVNTYNYDANDRLTSDVYDNDGNTTSSTGITNAYDFENYLIQHGAESITLQKTCQRAQAQSYNLFFRPGQPSVHASAPELPPFVESIHFSASDREIHAPSDHCVGNCLLSFLSRHCP